MGCDGGEELTVRHVCNAVGVSLPDNKQSAGCRERRRGNDKCRSWKLLVTLSKGFQMALENPLLTLPQVSTVYLVGEDKASLPVIDKSHCNMYGVSKHTRRKNDIHMKNE